MLLLALHLLCNALLLLQCCQLCAVGCYPQHRPKLAELHPVQRLGENVSGVVSAAHITQLQHPTLVPMQLSPRLLVQLPMLLLSAAAHAAALPLAPCCGQPSPADTRVYRTAILGLSLSLAAMASTA